MTQRAMDSFCYACRMSGKHAINPGSTQPMLGIGTLPKMRALYAPLHHTSDCPGRRFLATPVAHRGRNPRRLLQWRVTVRATTCASAWRSTR
ncbi:hypothetical protein LI328DRAFT_127149 [Trichoderma asperelloides]|nr:hypothetical protein LI328DRAFT_127149 [Trichoderma asperelloides]